jgi:hypothetical protein
LLALAPPMTMTNDVSSLHHQTDRQTYFSWRAWVSLLYNFPVLVLQVKRDPRIKLSWRAWISPLNDQDSKLEIPVDQKNDQDFPAWFTGNLAVYAKIKNALIFSRLRSVENVSGFSAFKLLLRYESLLPDKSLL